VEVKGKATPLPKELEYLEPVLRKMRKIPVEELNEDTDATAINEAVLGRIEALGKRGVSRRLAADRETLRRWLEESGAEEPAAWWIVGYLMMPGSLLRRLLSPAKPLPPSPEIVFEAPDGWVREPQSFPLCIRKGKIFASVQVIDADTLEHLRCDFESRPLRLPDVDLPESDEKWVQSVVKFDDCHGYRYTYTQSVPFRWKSVDYLLEVPGGAVCIWIGGLKGEDFDESIVESQLHTVRVIEPGKQNVKQK
jgi:hypothetical protein